MAEGLGFEPREELLVPQSLSRRLLSATQPPLRQDFLRLFLKNSDNKELHSFFKTPDVILIL